MARATGTSRLWDHLQINEVPRVHEALFDRASEQIEERGVKNSARVHNTMGLRYSPRR